MSYHRPLVLVDAMNLAFRSHHAMQGLTSDAGPTDVIFGFLKGIQDLHVKLGLVDVIVCWEGGKSKSWRRRYINAKEYKANRVPTADTKLIFKQLDAVKECLRILGYYQISVPGLEADDVIGVLSREAALHSLVYILSTDRDLFQLIGPRTVVLRKEKKVYRKITSKIVEEDFGVSVSQWAKYKALVGDSSDNYKGMPGCGPVNACLFLVAGIDPSLENFHEHLPRIRHAYKSKVGVHWDAIHKCYLLAKIPRSPKFKFFQKKSRQQLQSVVERLYSVRQRLMSKQHAEVALRKFVSFCATYKLHSFIADKRQFFQSIKIV